MACFNGYVSHPYEASLPPVSVLLMREAEAWRALLGLHQGVVGAARQLASATNEGNGASASLETSREAIEARESNYYAGLTQLVAQCDQLSTEALRLRALRKSRASADVQALEMLMQAHSIETLAIGGALACSSAVAVQAVTAELRQAEQSTRQQLAQVRAVMQLVQDKPDLRGRLTLGYRDNALGLDEVFDAVYAHSEELTDEALVRALDGLVGAAAPGAAPAVAVERQRTIVRRHADGNRSWSGS